MILFGRNIELTIISTKNDTKLFSSKDGFSIEFDIGFGTKSISTIKVYNVLPVTVEMCKPEKAGTKQVKFAKVELSAGYGDEITKILSANIISIEEKQNGIDRILEIKAGANVNILQNSYVLETFEKQTTKQILTKLFSMNKVTAYEINLMNDSVISSIALSGTLLDAVKSICKKVDAIFFVNNGKIFINSKNYKGLATQEVVILAKDSGLIGIPEISGNKIKVKCLLTPSLITGVIFKLEYFENSTQKKLSIDCLVGNGKHHGGNKIDSFYTEFECAKK